MRAPRGRCDHRTIEVPLLETKYAAPDRVGACRRRPELPRTTLAQFHALGGCLVALLLEQPAMA
eukprot:347895-Amphidinium_carterae.2